MMKKFWRSARFAINGMRYAFVHERNFRIEVFFTLLVLTLSVVFQISLSEFIIIAFLVMVVLGLELVNSSFECIVDLVQPTQHPQARAIKDMMAAAVLLSSIVAAIIGIIIFLPYLRALFV